MSQPDDPRMGTGRRQTDWYSPAALRDLLHDLGHNLATVALLTESVITDDTLAAATRGRVELIAQEVARLLDLVRGTSSTDRPVDVHGLLGQFVSVVAATGAPVALAPGEPVHLHVDATLLWRVVANLVDNAVRAAGQAGRVRVAVKGAAGRVTVEVADDGPGFGAGPPGRDGRGLGIVDALVRAAGGTIDIQPELPTGTRIAVVFPRDADYDGPSEAT
ncbi:sensor histidine kinase [Actinokineospora sp.]|uniref:sensor histidine kinase n=1 Tax=Actinokineospora sp. TaxID=1872133 RepID=UPI00403817FA